MKLSRQRFATHTGQGRAGQGRAGQGRAGQGRAGQGSRVHSIAAISAQKLRHTHSVLMVQVGYVANKICIKLLNVPVNPRRGEGGGEPRWS